MREPLTSMEVALFESALLEAVVSEFTPRVNNALLTGTTNVPGD